MAKKKYSNRKGKPQKQDNDNNNPAYEEMKLRKGSSLNLGNNRKETMKIISNEEDEFDTQQDEILLNDTYNKYVGRKNSDDEDDILSDDGLNNEEEVFSLYNKNPFDSDDEDEDEDEEKEEEQTLKRNSNLNKKSKVLDDEEEEDEDLEFLRKLQSNLGANKILQDEYADINSDEEMDLNDKDSKKKRKRKSKDDEDINSDVDDGAWGSKKAAYYDADVVSDEDTVEHRKDEEKEAIRLQNERARNLSKSDYMGDLFDDSFMSLMNKTKSLTEKTLSKEDDDDDDLDIEEKNSIFDSSSEDEDAEKDEDADKIELDEIDEFIPDVAMFIEDAKDIWNNIKSENGKALNWNFGSFSDDIVKSLKDINLDGKKYLELKSQIKLAYIYNIMYYLYLKINPPKSLGKTKDEIFKSLQNHPCVEYLLRLRDTIDELEHVIEGKVNEDDENDLEHMEDMEVMDQLSDEEVEDNSEDEDEEDADLGIDINDTTEQDVNNEEEKTIEQDNYMNKNYKGIDFIIQEMNNIIQLSGKPIEDNNESASEEEKEIESQQLNVKKSGSKKRKLSSKSDNKDQDGDEKDALAYYNEIAAKTQINKSIKKDRKEKEKEIALSMLQEERAMYINETDLSKNDEEDEEEGDDSVKRPANWRILSNKGLTPYRPKENRNPRVKRRKKYEKAQKKLRTFKQVAKDRTTMGDYSGESTGIKTNLSRSVKFV